MSRRIFLAVFLISIYAYLTYYYTLPKTINIPTLANHEILLEIQNNSTEEIEKSFANESFHLYNREWKPISIDSKNCCFIYSAYHDSRTAVTELYTKDKTSTLIRIIGIALKVMKRPFFQCHFQYSNKILSFKATAVKVISESHNGRYSAFFILCKLDHNQELPPFVGFTDQKIEGNIKDYVNFVRVSYPREKSDKNDRNIAVCPGPVFSSYDNALRIAEMIEIYKILGANKFYIYNASISEDVTELLKFYESQGTVEFLPWNIADIIELRPEVIHHYGLLGCLNDCFYYATLVDNFKYFIHADFDEIIFPYKVDTLTEYLEKFDNTSFHSHVFFNYFFFYEYIHDLSNVPTNAINKFLYTQAQTIRTSSHLKPHERTKYIAKGDSVIEVGNHFIWQSFGGKKECTVNDKFGALHHYRDNCTMFKLCDVKKSNDEHARKFASELWKNVDDVCGKVYADGKCPLGRNVTESFGG